MAFEPDVVVVGAGAAGLTAAGVLSRAGIRVQIVEARDRIGGRIWTVHETGDAAALELGAEFIHGRPPQIFEVLGRVSALADEMAGTDWCARGGELGPCHFFDGVQACLARMQYTPEDQSFADFVRHSCPDVADDVKRKALAYVEGFNAARAEEISVNSLVRSYEAEDRIDAGHTFRLASGYDFLPRMLLAACEPENLRISFNAVVRRVEHRPGSVTIIVQSGGSEERLTAPRALLTLPVAVWQSGSVEFRPALSDKEAALSQLEMGKVLRVSLRFTERFWATAPARGTDLADLRFLFSDDEWFPTWWTQAPLATPVMTGWAPSRAAERLAGRPESQVVQCAVNTLACLLGASREELGRLVQKAYLHDWQEDPFARGAYSYVRVGGERAPGQLGAAVQDTLYFAGEATDVEGYFGTVHGAMASGQRAAAEILQAVSPARAA